MNPDWDGPVVQGYGDCLLCRRPFMFNPHAVPSFQGEPVCADCMAEVNRRREANGVPPLPVRPDAYEPLPADLL